MGRNSKKARRAFDTRWDIKKLCKKLGVKPKDLRNRPRERIIIRRIIQKQRR